MSMEEDTTVPTAGCDFPNSPCLICGHEGCGWCPDCSPEVPD